MNNEGSISNSQGNNYSRLETPSRINLGILHNVLQLFSVRVKWYSYEENWNKNLKHILGVSTPIFNTERFTEGKAFISSVYRSKVKHWKLHEKVRFLEEQSQIVTSWLWNKGYVATLSIRIDFSLKMLEIVVKKVKQKYWTFK